MLPALPANEFLRVGWSARFGTAGRPSCKESATFSCPCKHHFFSIGSLEASSRPPSCVHWHGAVLSGRNRLRPWSSSIKSCVREAYQPLRVARHFAPSGARLTRSGLPYASDEWWASVLNDESERQGYSLRSLWNNVCEAGVQAPFMTMHCIRRIRQM